MSDEQGLNWEQTLFNIILHAGNARSKALAAAEEAESGNYAEAEALLADAETEQAEAHKVHAKITIRLYVCILCINKLLTFNIDILRGN